MQNATMTLFRHVRDDGFREQKRRRHIHPQHPLPELHLRVCQPPHGKAAHQIDQHIEAPVTLNHLAHDSLDVRFIGYVGLKRRPSGDFRSTSAIDCDHPRARTDTDRRDCVPQGS